MIFCIDDANVEAIRRIYDKFPIDGVSTNPAILALPVWLARARS